ncbi:MAG: F0F1 ATP synthase subunit A [Bacteroidia bacterium]|nr:F0F1 ATP synthase subunit A [Bacteroidia bacterium]
MKTRILRGLLILSLSIAAVLQSCVETIPVSKEEKAKAAANEKFDASTFIMEHIADSHEWHLWTTKKENDTVEKVTYIPLPVILISREKGFNFFFSNKIAHGQSFLGYKVSESEELKGKIINVDETDEPTGTRPLDFSITKTITGMLFAAIFGLWIFLSLARSYKKTGISYPHGIQSFLEPVVLFIRDDIALPNLGEHKYERYMPYLLSAFFFILINNLMGLIPVLPPFGANVTGNVGVTFVLALCTFLITQFSGNKAYWKHVFAAPGVPVWLLPVMIPVELIGLISKPFALMIRLFANITAGHIIVLSLICLIFIFDSLAVAPVSILFVVFMDCLELLVAFLQAYIFTLLSALFISMAVPEEHH